MKKKSYSNIILIVILIVNLILSYMTREKYIKALKQTGINREIIVKDVRNFSLLLKILEKNGCIEKSDNQKKEKQ